MARTDTLRHFLTDIANSIRNKKGTTDTIPASDFDTEIASIESGVDINEYLSDTITKGNYSLGGWSKTIKKIRSPLTIEGTNASYMFYNYPLNELPQIDTSNVTNMDSMFYNCPNLTEILQLDTSNVTTMSRLFLYCYNLTTIPQIDTSNVTNMRDMFGSCYNLTAIPQLDTSKVIDIANMFYNCKNLTTIPQLDTSNVTTMSSTFDTCTNLTTIPQLNGKKLTNVSSTFTRCNSLKNFDGLINLGQAYLTSQSANYNSYKLNLSSSTLLTEQSIINILNNLYDIKSKGCNVQSVVLGSTNLAKLTSEEGQAALNQATAYGWTIS